MGSNHGGLQSRQFQTDKGILIKVNQAECGIATAHNMKGIENMVVATYKSNRKSQTEYIRVHKYSSEDKLRVESIGISYACEVGGIYDTL